MLMTDENTQKEVFDEALSLYSKRKYQEALPLFQSIKDPSLEILTRYYLGLSYVQLGLFDEGLEEYRKIREIPRTIYGVEYDRIMYGLYINMGSILQNLAKRKNKKLYEEAINCYQQALKIQQIDPRVWNNLGNAYLDLEQYPEAIKSMKKAIELDDEFPEAYYSLSLAYEFSGNYVEAIVQLKKGLKWKAKNKIYLNRIAALCFGTGKFEEAKKYAQKALDVDPNDPTANKNFALILYNMQEYKEAYDYYQKLIKIQPDFNEPELKSIFDDLKKRVKVE